MSEKQESRALTTKEQKREAIESAASVQELDTMWAEWESRGFSRDGLLYAAILARKHELGIKLPEGDIERIERARASAKRGSVLPPISGRVKR